MSSKFTIFALLAASLLAVAASVNGNPAAGKSTGKLLYILLDGFRYDYLDDLTPEDIPGFTQLLSNGVKAEFVNPIVPTVSYPSWTTLVTGLYAESHNIIGNYFYDDQDKDYFSLDDERTTGKEKWWTAEPIWTTSTKAGLRVALHHWSRCDIPFDGVLPEFCERYEDIGGTEIFRTNIEKSLTNFQEGFDHVHVYLAHIDNVVHGYGPRSEERRQAMRDVDVTIVYLLEQLAALGLDDQVNIVIVSDHGATEMISGLINYPALDDYLPQSDCVESIADRSAFTSIKVNPGYLDEVFNSLSAMPGVSVYKHDDIPEQWHIKDSKYMYDIYVQADIGTSISESSRPEQLPPHYKSSATSIGYGSHGYLADEMDMKSIFFANGPAFKSNAVIAPIDMVDIYSALAHVLNIEGLPNNGTFQHVVDAFN